MLERGTKNQEPGQQAKEKQEFIHGLLTVDHILSINKSKNKSHEPYQKCT